MRETTKKRSKTSAKCEGETAPRRLENVTLAGAIAEGLEEIRSSAATLIVAAGQENQEREVLVPLMDWQVFGGKLVEIGKAKGGKPDDAEAEPSEEPGPRLHSCLLTLENLAFLMQELGYDVREAVRILALQAKGGIAPPESRMRYTADMLRLACEYMTATADQIEAELAGPAGAGEA